MINTNIYPSMNPLHPNEIKQRRKRYTDILNKVQLRPPFSIARSILHQQHKSVVIDLLTEAKPYNTDFSKQMLQLDRALKQSLVGHDNAVVHMQGISRQNLPSPY